MKKRYLVLILAAVGVVVSYLLYGDVAPRVVQAQAAADIAKNVVVNVPAIQRYNLHIQNGDVMQHDSITGNVYLLDPSRKTWVRIRIDTLDNDLSGDSPENMRRLQRFQIQ